MVKRFLEEGDKVKLTVKFKGRELAHPNLGRDVLDQVRLTLGDNLIVEAPPKMEGKSMTMLVSAKPHKTPSKPTRPVDGVRVEAAPKPAQPAPQPVAVASGAEK
jgi:translation initiation factor IF-3